MNAFILDLSFFFYSSSVHIFGLRSILWNISLKMLDLKSHLKNIIITSSSGGIQYHRCYYQSYHQLQRLLCSIYLLTNLSLGGKVLKMTLCVGCPFEHHFLSSPSFSIPCFFSPWRISREVLKASVVLTGCTSSVEESNHPL